MTYADSGNALLDLIAHADSSAADDLMRGARLLDMASGQTLRREESEVDTCYFPVSGVLTLTAAVDGAVPINTLVMGFDGAVHATVGTNLRRSRHRVICRLPGQSWEVEAGRWHALVESNKAVRRIVSIFTDFALQRTQQMLACERLHDVESRTCRSLAELHSWQKERPLEITHQGLSELLGVRRTTVTLVARALQGAGIISYKRGTIEVSDLYALREASCGCHEIPHAWRDLCKAALAAVA